MPRAQGILADPPVAELLPLAPSSLAEGWLWADAGPALALSDAAIHPDDERVWAVVARDGACLVSTDAGGRWTSVRGPTGGRGSRDEQALAEIEARLGELASAVEAPDASLLEDGELDEEELASELERAAEEAR